MTEAQLRARAIELRDELRKMADQAAGLFRTSGWIRTSEEAPPIGMTVLGVGAVNGFGWYVLEYDGKWQHNYMNGHTYEETWAPEFWMVVRAPGDDEDVALPGAPDESAPP